MFQKLRMVVVIGALLIVAAAAARAFATQKVSAAAAPQESALTPLQTVNVDQGDVVIAVNATGNIQAKQNVALGFETSGKVSAVLVKEGDFVRKGQTIATLDTQAALDAAASAQARVAMEQVALNQLLAKPRPEDIAVAQAFIKLQQANVDESKIGGSTATQVQIAQANAELAKNQLWQTQLTRDGSNLTKNQLLSNPRTASQAAKLPSDTQNEKTVAAAEGQVSIAQDNIQATLSQGANPGSIQAAQANLTIAQIQLQNLLAGPNADDLKQAQANLAAAQSALDQAKQDLVKTRLVAPLDGQIATINLSVGQQSPTSQAVILVDTHSFYVDLPVAELDIAKVKLHQPVNLHFQSLPNVTIKGAVTQISDVANTGTPVTYTVEVEFDPTGEPLLTGMSTTTSIVTGGATDVIRLPNRFIRIDRTQNKTYATVQQPDGTFKEVEIQIGSADDTYTEIKTGLELGDVVTVPQAGGNGPNGPGGFALRRLVGG